MPTEPRIGKQPMGELGPALGGTQGRPDMAGRVGPRLEHLHEKIEIADNNRQEIVEFVGDAGGMLDQRLHLVGLA